MRIVHVFLVSEIGGAETALLNLMRHRERSDIEHYAVLVTDQNGALGEDLTRLGVLWQRVPRGRMRQPRLFWRACHGLRRAIRDSRADVVLANSPQGFLYARASTIGLGLPVVVYYMTAARPQLWENNGLDILMAFARPSAVFTASRAIGLTLARWGLSKVQPVYHGTRLQPVQPVEMIEVQNILGKRGVSLIDPVILLPGRLQPWKGQHVLIAALPAVLSTFPHAHAVLLGGTLFGLNLDYADELRRQIAELSLARRVHLVGPQPIRGWLDRAAIVVHTSTQPDPFPNVCIEALAARRPLITNTISGTCEILVNEVDALIVEPNDPAMLAAAIVKLLNDPSAAARMADAGHQRYLATCTPGHMVQPIETMLASLVGLPTAAGDKA